jgi:hypothetical protein
MNKSGQVDMIYHAMRAIKELVRHGVGREMEI